MEEEKEKNKRVGKELKIHLEMHEKNDSRILLGTFYAVFTVFL